MWIEFPSSRCRAACRAKGFLVVSNPLTKYMLSRFQPVLVQRPVVAAAAVTQDLPPPYGSSSAPAPAQQVLKFVVERERLFSSTLFFACSQGEQRRKSSSESRLSVPLVRMSELHTT